MAHHHGPYAFLLLNSCPKCYLTLHPIPVPMLVLALDALMADTAARPPLHAHSCCFFFQSGIRPAGLAGSLSLYIYIYRGYIFT